jgi:hypothetical protein
MVVERVHHLLAYVAAGAAVFFVLLAGISRLTSRLLWLTISAYLDLAIFAILFAIYLLIQGMVFAAQKKGGTGKKNTGK